MSRRVVGYVVLPSVSRCHPVEVLRDADPADEAAVYRGLGLKQTHVGNSAHM
jgi:hypothetical protein